MNGTEVEVIRQEVIPIPEQAKMIVVKDAVTMAKANAFYLIIKGLRKRIAATFDPMESAAKETKRKAEEGRKIIVEQRAELEAPLIAGENWVNRQMTAYKLEQDRIRQEEEARLRKIAIQEEIDRRKKIEEDKLAEAELLEKAGMKEESQQLVSEAIQEQEAPMTVKTAEPETPKVVMEGATLQTNWKFEIVKESLIPRSYLIPDMGKIGSTVRADKERCKIPGVRTWPDIKTRATGR